jgi:hypothetical protein
MKLIILATLFGITILIVAWHTGQTAKAPPPDDSPCFDSGESKGVCRDIRQFSFSGRLG